MRPGLAAVALAATLVTATACSHPAKANVTFVARTATATHGPAGTNAPSPNGTAGAPARATAPVATAASTSIAATGDPGTATPDARARPQAPGCLEAAAPGETVAMVTQGADVRAYRLHVPPSYTPPLPAPLVLNFHGYAQDAAQQESYSGLATVADEAGFVLVTPEGSESPESWDIVGVYEDDGRDDVAFVRALVTKLTTELCIDPARVYATGHSNGAEMASQLGCFAPDLVAAVAPVSGAVFQDCDGGPVPLISFHGTDDENVPFDETAADIDAWAKHNGCASPPQEERYAEHVRLDVWPDCGGNDVLLYVIDGGGHTWPGSRVPGGAGAVTDEIDASRVIWSFFAAHPKR